jgi:hypothetical protein
VELCGLVCLLFSAAAGRARAYVDALAAALPQRGDNIRAVSPLAAPLPAAGRSLVKFAGSRVESRQTRGVDYSGGSGGRISCVRASNIRQLERHAKTMHCQERRLVCEDARCTVGAGRMPLVQFCSLAFRRARGRSTHRFNPERFASPFSRTIFLEAVTASVYAPTVSSFWGTPTCSLTAQPPHPR